MRASAAEFAPSAGGAGGSPSIADANSAADARIDQPAGNPGDSLVWTVDNLKALGGHPITKVVGNPTVIDTPGGKAVQFSGGDALFVADQPIAAFARWTADVIFP